MINADLENDLQTFGQNSRLSSVAIDGIQEENSVSGTGDTRTAAPANNKLDQSNWTKKQLAVNLETFICSFLNKK